MQYYNELIRFRFQSIEKEFRHAPVITTTPTPSQRQDNAKDKDNAKDNDNAKNNAKDK